MNPEVFNELLLSVIGPVSNRAMNSEQRDAAEGRCSASAKKMAD